MQYTLTCGGASAIVDSLGGEMISYKNASGKEYVWCGNPTYWASHAPVLFPICSALKDGKVNIGGKEFEMGKHGFCRMSEFEATDIGASSATFTLRANEATLAQYPSKFALAITHSITEAGFTTSYKVTNEGSEDMYFCLGGHPGFSCPLNEGESFEDYALVFDTPITEKHPYYTSPASLMNPSLRLALDWDGTTLPLRYDDFDIDAYLFLNPEAKSLTLAHSKTGEGAKFDFFGFANLAVWSPPHKKAPFVCLEPWQGLPAYEDETGNIEDKPNVVCLASGAQYDAGYTITPIAAQ